jgi:hypothetical protein
MNVMVAETPWTGELDIIWRLCGLLFFESFHENGHGCACSRALGSRKSILYHMQNLSQPVTLQL